jgi:hypothetical protein
MIAFLFSQAEDIVLFNAVDLISNFNFNEERGFIGVVL